MRRALFIAICVVFALVVGHALRRAYVDPDACISEEMKTIPNLNGTKVEIVYTSCDTLAKDEAVKVYFSKTESGDESWYSKWRNQRTLVFWYDPEGEEVPKVESPGKGKIVISISKVSSIARQERAWEGISIDYQVGHVAYP